MSDGLSFGTYKMSQTSDMAINEISTTENNYIRIDTFRKANDLRLSAKGEKVDEKCIR